MSTESCEIQFPSVKLQLHNVRIQVINVKEHHKIVAALNMADVMLRKRQTYE